MAADELSRGVVGGLTVVGGCVVVCSGTDNMITRLVLDPSADLQVKTPMNPWICISVV